MNAMHASRVGSTTNWPSGLFKSAAILEIIELGETPAETVRPEEAAVSSKRGRKRETARTHRSPS